MEKSLEWQRGYDLAQKLIDKGDDPTCLHKQADQGQEVDEFDRGWIEACKDRGSEHQTL